MQVTKSGAYPHLLNMKVENVSQTIDTKVSSPPFPPPLPLPVK